MSDPMRVALLTPSLSTGGAERQILKLAAALDPADVELTIVILFRGEANQLLPYVPSTATVIEAPYGRRDPRTVWWLARVLRERRIEVAHSFLWSADFFAALATLFVRRTTLICSERGDRGLVQPLVRRFLDRIVTFRSATLVCANSRFGSDLLVRAGCPADKVRVIPNGVTTEIGSAGAPVDIRRRFGWSDETPVIGAVTRLVRFKGIETLIRAFAIVAREMVAGCVIVGDGPDRARLEALADELHLGARLQFVGAQHPPEPWTNALDVFVLPTIAATEHCSNSILEAMAAGKPVVASRVAGNPELVIEGKTGSLFAPNDHEELAAVLSALLRDRDRAAAFGRAGRERVEREFRMTAVATRVLGLWRTARHARPELVAGAVLQ